MTIQSTFIAAIILQHAPLLLMMLVAVTGLKCCGSRRLPLALYQIGGSTETRSGRYM